MDSNNNVMRVMNARNLRELVRMFNEYNRENKDSKIKRENIISVLKDEGQYFLIYLDND